MAGPLVDVIEAEMERAAFEQHLPVSGRALRPLAEAAAHAVAAELAKPKRRPLTVPGGFREGA